MKINCDQCGEIFNKPPNRIKICKKHFCSKKCQDLSQIKRIQKNCRLCGDGFEIRPSERERFNICPKDECQKQKRLGKNNSRWIDGKYLKKSRRTNKKALEWRETVLHRDGYKCQHCGTKHSLTAHHIKEVVYYPELMYDIDNGLTLCIDCHHKEHSESGFYREVNLRRRRI